MRVGLLHPGEMGAAVGAALEAGGAHVLWAAEGRSDATRARAEAAGLTDVGTLARLVERSETIVSVCPPHAALDLARAVSACGFTGAYVDVNAVAPRRHARSRAPRDASPTAASSAVLPA